jgi:general secretion pathway protein C
LPAPGHRSHNVIGHASVFAPDAPDTRKQTVKHLPRVVAILLTSAVLGSGAYWGSALLRPPSRPVAAAPHTAPAPPDIAAAAGLFGGAPAAPSAIAFKLKGVIEDGQEGVAILVEDGKPALAVGIGQQAAPGVTVTEIHQRYVMLDMSGKPTRLDLPDAGTAGPGPVAAAVPASTAQAAPAAPTTSFAPAAPVTSATPAAPSGAPVHVASSGAAPPAGQPAARPPGLTSDQMRQQYEERRRQEMEQIERARRASGMPPPSGAGPTT